MRIRSISSVFTMEARTKCYCSNLLKYDLSWSLNLSFLFPYLLQYFNTKLIFNIWSWIFSFFHSRFHCLILCLGHCHMSCIFCPTLSWCSSTSSSPSLSSSFENSIPIHSAVCEICFLFYFFYFKMTWIDLLVVGIRNNIWWLVGIAEVFLSKDDISNIRFFLGWIKELQCISWRFRTSFKPIYSMLCFNQ